METGSFYEIDPASCRNLTEGERSGLRLAQVEKYKKRQVRYTASGREAIALALRGLEKARTQLPRRCLLPAYMCDSVFPPFIRRGWEISFYHVNRGLEADERELRWLVEKLQPGLIFVHAYYGMDTAASIRPFLGACRERGICIMEDVTQSYYLEGIGAEADYVVGSLRKWYPVPDGGFVAADSLPEEKLPLDEAFVAGRLEQQMQKWEYLQGGRDSDAQRALKEEFLRRNRESEAWLDAYEGVRGLSPEAAHILNGVSEAECRDRRRENYVLLYERLRTGKQAVPILRREKGDTAAPLYLAVYAQDREELQRFLGKEEIYAPVLWPVGEENEECLTKDERYIYEHMLALPIDQRYGRTEMEHVAKVLERYERQRAGEEVIQSGYGQNGHAPEGHASGGSAPEGAGQRDFTGDCGKGTVIGIRADANDTVATGHIMRCITIARELIRAGSRVIFFTADECGNRLLYGAGMAHVCLHTDWKHMEEELPKLRRLLKEQGCKKLLVDSYQATEAYYEGLRDICRIACIDDCFESVWPVDLVINYNAYHVRFPYRKAYAGRAGLLLGTAYVPLRREFGRKRGGEPGEETAGPTGETAPEGRITGRPERRISGRRAAAETEAFHVLLSSGGGDRCHALVGILSALYESPALYESFEPSGQGRGERAPGSAETVPEGWEQVIFHVVMGDFHGDRQELESLAGVYPNIRLYHGVSNMAELMAQCDAAVSAAGTMLFELSAMQVPTVFFVSADNQQYDREFFGEEERMLFAGDIRKGRQDCLEKVLAGLMRLRQDKALRSRMKAALGQVTDGCGAYRIAEAILRMPDA